MCGLFFFFFFFFLILVLQGSKINISNNRLNFIFWNCEISLQINQLWWQHHDFSGEDARHFFWGGYSVLTWRADPLKKSSAFDQFVQHIAFFFSLLFLGEKNERENTPSYPLLAFRGACWWQSFNIFLVSMMCFNNIAKNSWCTLTMLCWSHKCYISLEIGNNLPTDVLSKHFWVVMNHG